MLLCLLLPFTAFAQSTAAPQPPAPPSSQRPFEIVDNSFLVEEAFNQEAGIFQNIFGHTRVGGGWSTTFTQEWPVVSQQHQFSYTLSGYGGGGISDFGDVMLNYRYQALHEDPGLPAFSPRLSLIIPTGDDSYRSLGLQLNLPFSKQRGDLYFHWNAGMTWYPSAESPVEDVNLLSPHISASAIYRVRPMLNLMLESVVDFQEFPDLALGGTDRETVFTISPGGRGGWNIGDHQLILGVAVPIVITSGRSDTGFFFYTSYELPFKR